MSQTYAKTFARPSFRQGTILVVSLSLAATLSGCGVDRTVTGSIVDDNINVRHPIVLAQAPTTLDIFPGGQGKGSLDHGSLARVRDFGKTYAQNGSGQIVVMVPQGGAEAASAHQAIDSIRRELVAGGAKGFISVGSYPVADPTLAAPVRLTFSQLQARVAKPCGEWPADLASGSSVEGWNNRPYWNFGCAYQQAIAVQIDNVRDLAGPRAEQPADTEARSRAILAVRKGDDPGTNWKTRNSTISQIGN